MYCPLLVLSHSNLNTDPGGTHMGVCFADINGHVQVQTLLADSNLTTVTVCSSPSSRCISWLLALWRALVHDLYLYSLTAQLST